MAVLGGGGSREGLSSKNGGFGVIFKAFVTGAIEGGRSKNRQNRGDVVYGRSLSKSTF